MIRKFRRKQIEEGMQFKGTAASASMIAEWSKGAFQYSLYALNRLFRKSDDTEVEDGEWVVKEVINENNDSDMGKWRIFTDEQMKKYFIDTTDVPNENGL